MTLSHRIALHERLEAAKPKAIPPRQCSYSLYPGPNDHLDPRGPDFCRICGLYADTETQLCAKHFGRALKAH